MSVKSIVHAKKNYGWNSSTCICENSRYLKSIVDDSVVVCNEIINVGDSAWTNLANTISTNVTSTVQSILMIKM